MTQTKEHQELVAIVKTRTKISLFVSLSRSLSVFLCICLSRPKLCQFQWTVRSDDGKSKTPTQLDDFISCLKKKSRVYMRLFCAVESQARQEKTQQHKAKKNPTKNKKQKDEKVKQRKLTWPSTSKHHNTNTMKHRENK